MLFLRPKCLLSSNFTPSINCRLLSTVSSSPPSSGFAAQYLIDSCGLPSDKALRASRYIPQLKSPDKADAVLRFLRRIGVTEPHIRAAASRQASFLCIDLERHLKPRVAELKEIGFSPSDISLVLSICPQVFAYRKLQQKIQFWLQIFGSKEKLLFLFEKSFFLLTVNFETSVLPNLSFLKEQCGLSDRQIVRLITSLPRLIVSKHANLESKAKRAEELGISRSSKMFVYALVAVSRLNQDIIDARILYLKSHGFSHEEVTGLISRYPQVLEITEELIGRKMDFLINEACCDRLHLVRNPVLLRYSLEKRLIPRNHVRKLLKCKGLPAANQSIAAFVLPNEKQFIEKFVLPYELAIPGLQQAYADSCSGKATFKD